MKVLVTGSSGLIGSEAVLFFDNRGDRVYGIDNNMRMDFFGEEGDTTPTLNFLVENTDQFQHNNVDIRDYEQLEKVFDDVRPDLIIHCAAQPSHDLAASRPLDDFHVNASGTMNLLELTRQYIPESVFVHMSTNKVYGDAPNERPLVELETRWDFQEEEDFHGIDESCRVDRCLHSLFGASKLAADVMVQEYGKYFGLKTGVFRGGCLTGAKHAGVELHGFLNYLVKCASIDRKYTIFGYKGKQVRDQIHSYDVINAFWNFAQDPRPGEVYNLGGSRENSVSVLEAIDRCEQEFGRPMETGYTDDHRSGDHICYISDIRKFQDHFPEWELTWSLDEIFADLFASVSAGEQLED